MSAIVSETDLLKHKLPIERFKAARPSFGHGKFNWMPGAENGWRFLGWNQSSDPEFEAFTATWHLGLFSHPDEEREVWNHLARISVEIEVKKLLKSK